ncbi:MAG: DUF4965 domain-containing protein [Verrucomicrobia bacterium]|nr:DUF4965 domain-containing protein [Verrucomicrobiota bacterium]
MSPTLSTCLRRLATILTLSVAAVQAAPLRPPAVPLVTHDPYFSIWSGADKLTETDTTHWTGKPHRLTALVRIDGKAYRVLGKEPAEIPALPQTGVEVHPTRTIAGFSGAGIRLTLTFLTPSLPDDLDVLSRPVTYVAFESVATDGGSHDVACYFDAAAEIAVNEPRQAVTFSRADTAALSTVRIGSSEQPVLAKKGDDLRIDWGYFYLAAPTANGATTHLLPPDMARGAFASGGAFPKVKMACPVPAADAPAACAAFNDAKISATPVSQWLMLAYDDEFSIRYFRAKLRPYWRRNAETAEGLLEHAAADYPALLRRCAEFDTRLTADLTRFGEPYAQLCALAYRQTLAGNKLAADAKGQPLLFPKENFSNGCIGTVDVLYPQAPFFLALSPALAKAMLQPVLDYAASAAWPYDYAPHDLGTYPHATGQVYGMAGKDGDRMPVEESGNMLIMLAALSKCEGNADYVKPYRTMLAKWADYLVREGLDPQNQLCSADMFGHLPRAANLGLKAVIAIGGYAQLCDLAGDREQAAKYRSIARDYAAKWQVLAKDEGHTRLAYHLPGTWCMKHNLIWDRILGTNLLPPEVAAAEIAHYRKVQMKYGLPVDNRTDTSLLDWALWSIAPATDPQDFNALLDPIWRYANETPSRVPLSDWFVTTDARQKGFQARPVVGGVYIKLLAEPELWLTWSRRGANITGPWAPTELGGPIREIVPTARKKPAIWRFTTAQPPPGWTEPGFDDSTWSSGPAGFGTKGTPGLTVGTVWQTKGLWLRREFVLPDRPLRQPRFLLVYDENPEIYLNGVPAAKLPGWVTGYEEADIAPAALATLKPGKNVIAVRVSQTYGGQGIDVGIVEDKDPTPAGP